MDFDAFISYSSKDKTAADAACAVLESAGVRCWIAPRDIRPGGEYGAAIIDAIERCRVMVLIFSSNANESQQIRREIERAVSKGIPLVPVRIEEVPPTKSLEYFLGAIHWLDALSPPLEKHLHQLADTVKAILQSAGKGRDELATNDGRRTPPPAEANPAAKAGQVTQVTPRGSTRARWLIPALGAAAILLAGGAWHYRDAFLGRPTPPRTSQPAQPRTTEPGPPRTIEPTQPARKEATVLVPETVPFIAEGAQASIRNTYLSAADHKALAIGSLRAGFVVGQKDDETAKAGALDMCRKVSGDKANQCQLYAVGNAVVFKGELHMPPEPWLVRDPAIERPFVAAEVPLLRTQPRTMIEANFASWHKPKAIALTRGGGFIYYSGQTSIDEAVRRSLEWCGFVSHAPCLIVSVDDVFVVPIPATMKPTGLFQPKNEAAVASEARENLARRIANGIGGWSAVAVGAKGLPGLGLKAAKEQDAVDGALRDCRTRDHDCRVIAIGPFTVEAAEPKPTGVGR